MQFACLRQCGSPPSEIEHSIPSCLAHPGAKIRYLEQTGIMSACKARDELEQRWNTAVGVYAKASRELLELRSREGEH